MNENALKDVEMESYIYPDPVSKNLIQHDNMHTTALTLAERVQMDTLGMDTYLVDQIDTQTRHSISSLDLMDVTANGLDWNQDQGLCNTSDEHIGIRMEDTTCYPVIQDVMQRKILSPGTADHSTGPIASTFFPNQDSSAHRFESQPWPLYNSFNYANINLTNQVASAIPGITPPQFLSEFSPWTPVPLLQVDTQFCVSDDTPSSGELSSERRLSSTSLPVGLSNISMYASPVHPMCSSRLLQPMKMYEEQDIAPNLAQNFAHAHQLPTHSHGYNVRASSLVGEETAPLTSQLHLGERQAGTTRRWSCGSHLSAPGNMENTAPSPTPSEVSVTPSAYPDVLLCPVEGCGARFTGLYRRGNQRRHFRLIHNPVQYPCGVPGCYKTFNRQDARLKHHRKHHAYELPLLKPPSKRTSRKST